jgi:vacuolar-type H+-ATPase catalytic subunit A/Vma1
MGTLQESDRCAPIDRWHAYCDLTGMKVRAQSPASAKRADGILKTGQQMTDAWVEKTGGDAKSVPDAFQTGQTVAKAD